MTAQVIDLNQRRIAVRLSSVPARNRKGAERTGNRHQHTPRPGSDWRGPNDDGPSAA